MRRGCFSTKLAHTFLFSPIFVCPSAYQNLSPVLFTYHPPPTYLRFSSSDCPFCLHQPFTSISFCTSLLFATSLFLCGPLETRHVDRVPRPMSLEDGILVIEVTVGLQPLSANTSLWPRLQLDGRSNTSLWPRLQLDGRSGRPGLTNRLVAPLLWGCFTGVNQGCLTPEYILSIALVSLRRISGEKLTSPCWTQWRVGSG